MQALYRIKPARPNVSYSAPDQYPAWLEKRDRLRGVELEKFRFIETVFELEEEDKKLIEERFGKNVLVSNFVVFKRDYGGTISYIIEYNEKAAVQKTVSGLSLLSEIAEEVNKIDSFEELIKYTEGLTSSDNSEATQVSSLIMTRIKEVIEDASFEKALFEFIWKLTPEIFYYHEYSNLPYSVNIEYILKTDGSQLTDEELTALSLLRLAAADEEYLLNPDYERRKRELENIANALTDDVLKYWTQNPELRVHPDITQKVVTTPQGQKTVLDELKIRIWDQRHSLSLPFDEHSSGFRWFFSFLVAFSKYEFTDTPVIILLDEPALGLHARAQKDFLHFIEERLASRCQVIYTTHSPFMIQPGRLERVRIVEDRGRKEGAKIMQDVLTTDPDTLFPLQGALGYDLAQHLFIKPHNLVVEGTSDFTYLSVMSDHLRGMGRECLDERWSIVPVGGADMIPTFVALLGHHLDVAVVVDAGKERHQRLSRLAADGRIAEKRIVTIGEVLGQKDVNIEDLFAVEDYLALFNRTFGIQVKLNELQGKDSIINRITRYLGRPFDHGKPADTLLRCRHEILPQLKTYTLDNFEKLFRRINIML